MKKRVRWDRVLLLGSFILCSVLYFNSVHIANITDTAVIFDEDGGMAVLAIMSLSGYFWSIYEG